MSSTGALARRAELTGHPWHGIAERGLLRDEEGLHLGRVGWHLTEGRDAGMEERLVSAWASGW